MRIAIAIPQALFVRGGAEEHADNLVLALREAGHTAEQVRIPFNSHPPLGILQQILAVRLLDVTHSFGEPIDLVIGMKFPTYYIRHPNKVIWLLHQYRDAYDLLDSGDATWPNTPDGRPVRESIVRADNHFIPEARRVFTNSRNVSARLKRYNGIDAPPLYHPPPNWERLRTGPYGDYLFFPSRVTQIKRQHLAVEAMQYVPRGVRLVIAGPPDGPAEADALRAKVEQFDLADRVEILGRVTSERLLELYAGARAVVFPPMDEDYGYITLEAFRAGKAVITCTDSGGPLEFVADGETGWIASPSPRALGAAMAAAAGSSEESARRGARARDYITSLGLSWSHVIDKLTAP